MRFLKALLLLALPLASLVAADMQSAAVALSEPLARWRAEIERRGQRKVVLARVYTDAERNELILPEDAEYRPLLGRVLSSESFRRQFPRSHAMVVNLPASGARMHCILLNMALAQEWSGAEDALIAHEFGHVWLEALGYPSPAYAAASDPCVSVHSGDIVQHILIREEIRRRGIPYLGYWLRNLETAKRQLESQPGGAAVESGCRRLALLTLWLDSTLGLTPEQWNQLDEFHTLLADRFPGLRPHAAALHAYLRDLDLHDRHTYRDALVHTFQELASIVAGPADLIETK